MAGHSHWAGIKHKKGKADKIRSKLFSKLSREITVSVKMGLPDPSMNPRLRSAVQAARSANMPKDNIERAIDKSSIAADSNFENIRYEGFGPFNVALIIETLTDNKNRSASSIRTVLQKNGGRLGESGSTKHLFSNNGILHIKNDKIDDRALYKTNSGSKKGTNEGPELQISGWTWGTQKPRPIDTSDEIVGKVICNIRVLSLIHI